MIPILDQAVQAPGNMTGKLSPPASAADTPDTGPFELQFGDILRSEGAPRTADRAVALAELELLEGGNILQQGGKVLPDQTVPEQVLTAIVSHTVLPNEEQMPTDAGSTYPPPRVEPKPEALPELPVERQIQTSRGAEAGPAVASISSLQSRSVAQFPSAASLPSVSLLSPPPPVPVPVSASLLSPPPSVLPPPPLSALLNDVREPEHIAPAAPHVGPGTALATSSEHLQPTTPDFSAKGAFDLGAGKIYAGVAGTDPVAEFTEQISGLDANPVKNSQPSSLSHGGPPLAASSVDIAGAAKLPTVPAASSSQGGPNWNTEFAGRVSLVVKSGTQEASIQLSPPELGKLEIKISTDGDQAKVLFYVHGAAAKDAVEQAMPRLREMLEQDGLQLAHSDVFDDSRSAQKDSSEANIMSESMSDDRAEESTDGEQHAVLSVSADSLVDYYI